ncbi:MAG: hypothetical protein PVI23_07375 [Maricaulaceae bacterium]|jgi:hypothetical protein
MTTAAAEILVLCLALYALVGVIFALYFVAFGAPRIDPNAQNMKLGARLIIFPGAAGLWPLLIVKTLAKQGPPT